MQEVINNFFGQFDERHYKPGQILIYGGDAPEHVFHLVSGRVKVYDITTRGDEVVLNIFKPPAFFPMSYVINRGDNPYFYEAADDITVHLAPIDEVYEFITTNHDVLLDLIARVYRGTDGMLQRMAHLMASSAKSRVIFELIIECRRFGEAAGSAVTIGVSESDIASRAGLTRETVSREIAKLRTEGLIALDHKHIVVRNMQELEESLGPNL